MTITRLDHYNIRAPKAVVERVVDFYGVVFKLTPGQRPDFGIDGIWLYDDDYPMVHLTVDETAVVPGENIHLNHIAFRCVGMETYLERLDTAGTTYTDIYIPELDMTQVFFYDPAGIQIELDFPNEKTDRST